MQVLGVLAAILIVSSATDVEVEVEEERAVIQGFHAEMYWERWNTVANCIQKLLFLETALRTFWRITNPYGG